MGSIAGLVNYSDEEDSSSSGDEQVSSILLKKVDKQTISKPIVVNKPAQTTIKQTNSDSAPTADNVPKITNPPVVKPPPGFNEHHRRLMAALAAKPIEGVDNWGIPAEPSTPCDADRAERIAHFLKLRASGHRLNAHLQHNKSFRNPRIYTRLVEFSEVEEFGSNFSKEDFDPYGFPKELYIDEILETQKKLAEEKVAAQQNRTSVAFVPQTTELSQQQSSAMAQAMATAAKVASRIAKPPPQEEKRRNKWDDDRDSKRR